MLQAVHALVPNGEEGGLQDPVRLLIGQPPGTTSCRLLNTVSTTLFMLLSAKTHDIPPDPLAAHALPSKIFTLLISPLVDLLHLGEGSAGRRAP